MGEIGATPFRVLALDTSTAQGGVAIVERNQGAHHVLARATWKREKSHSEFLTPTIQDVLKKSNLQITDIDALAVGQGPGSFTGIRIAVNVARSLAFALKKPVYAFNTLEILAAAVPYSKLPLLVLVNAHKNLLFTTIYDWQTTQMTLTEPMRSTLDRSETGSLMGQWIPRGEVHALRLEALAGLVQEPILCIGDGYLEYENFFPLELKQSLVRALPTRPPLIGHSTHLLTGPSIERTREQSFDEPLPEVLGLLALARTVSSPPLDWNMLQALYIRASGAEESLETKQR